MDCTSIYLLWPPSGPPLAPLWTPLWTPYPGGVTHLEGFLPRLEKVITLIILITLFTLITLNNQNSPK